MSRLILYGRGLIAEEYARYLEAQGRGADIAAFAVTKMNGQGEIYCGRPCMEIEKAIEMYPEAEVHLSLQEKYHQEVLNLLKELGREPKEIIGLHRMTELLGEQGLKQISQSCTNLTVQRNPHDYSMLELFSPEHPEQKFTFYPMTQVPLSLEDLSKIQKTVSDFYGDNAASRSYLLRFRGREVREAGGLPGQGTASAVEEGQCQLYIAMATSLKDAKVTQGNLPYYIQPVLGGAITHNEPRSEEICYDDEEPVNISSHNLFYSELTVAHWLWQKAPEAKYLGLCHYRRHFVLTEEIQSAIAKGTIDVFLTTPRLTFPTVHTYFANLPVTTMDEQDYNLMLKLIQEEDSKLAKYAQDFLEGQIHFPNNMVIAKRDIYLDYCSFMFKVLQGMQEHYERNWIARPDRYLGYVGELLTTVYFAWHREKYRIAYIDYKLLREV